MAIATMKLHTVGFRVEEVRLAVPLNAIARSRTAPSFRRRTS